MKLTFLPLLLVITFTIKKCVCDDSPCMGKIEFDSANSKGGDGTIDWTSGRINSVTNFKDTDDLVFTYNIIGSIEISIETSDVINNMYIEGTVDNDASTLVIQTNDNFKNNLEDDYKEQAITQLVLSYNLKFTCDSVEHPNPISVAIYVTDTNNHQPKFLSDAFTYTMPSPLPPKLDLTGFGDPITVEDVDFTNNAMTFEIIDNDELKNSFELDTQDLGNKQFQALLKLKDYYSFDKDFSFTVRATDSGDPTQSSETTIAITKDGSSSLPSSMSFSQALYKFNYFEDEDGTPIVNSTDSTITITSDSTDEIVLTLNDGNQYFQVKLEDDKSTVTFESTTTPIAVTSDSVLTLELTATAGSISGSTIIRVDIPDDKVIIVPTFTKAFYTATYKVEDGVHSVTLDEEIALTEAVDNLVITLTENDNFALTKEDDKWTLSLVTNLDDATLAKGGEIDLALDAVVNDGTSDHHGTGVLIVKLPEVLQPPKFEKSIYKATYKLTGGEELDTVVLAEEIKVDDDVVISIEGRDNFEAQKDDDGKWQIVVKTNLNAEELKGEEIGVSLVATLSGKEVNPGYTTLVIQLPSASFGSAIYSATYAKGESEDTIEVTDGPIKVTAADETVDVQFAEDSHSAYFTINYNEAEQTYDISVNQTLTPDMLKEIDFVLIINALESGSVIASSFVVVTLPAINDIPKFSQELYTVSYEVNDDIDIITGETEINIVASTDQNVIVSFEEDNENFKIDQDETDKSKWVISLIKDLSDEDILNGGFKAYILKAVIDGSDDNYEESSLIVQLPSPKTLPKFGAPLYKGVYKIEDDSASVVIENQISLSSLEGDVSFKDTYATYFDFDINATPQITVKTPLDQTVITKNQEILLTLQVTTENSDSTESTIIVLKLDPHVDYLKTLKFEQHSYEFLYSIEGDNATIDQQGQTITLANETNSNEEISVTLVTGTYSNNFKITKSDNSYNLEIENPLNQTVLDSEVNILLVVNAHADGDDDGFATILLNLPNKEPDVNPQFSSSSYSGTYQLGKNNDSVKLDAKISLVTGNANLALDGTYKEYFELIQDNEDKTSYTVKVTKNLENSVLIGEVDVVLTVTATVEGASEPSAEVALVIKLPKQTSPAPFKSPNYEATYNRDVEPNTIDMTESIELTGNYVQDTAVVLQAPTDLEKYFNFSNASPYQINLNENIPDDALNSLNEIVLTLTASLEGTDLTTTATVVVKVSKILPPNFKQATFLASYDSDAGSVTLKEDIGTDAKDESTVTIAVENPYNENFAVIYNSDAKKFVVNVLKALDNTDEEIYVVLDATTAKATDHSTAVLVVKMPEKTENIVPTFEDVYYEAWYDNTTNTVNITGQIKITSEKESDTKVAVVQQYKDNFSTNRDDTGVWLIEVSQPLDDATLSNKEIYVELEATLSTSPNKGQAVIILNLPDQDKKQAPIFKKPFYTAEYTADDTLENPEDIEIESADSKNVVVTIQQEYQQYFNLKQSDSVWTISKGDSLSDELKKNSELRITITAHLDGSVRDTEAVYIITLPPTEETVGFENDVYEGSYAKDAKKGDPISTSEDIKTTEGATATIINNDYSDYFDIACADNKCTLTVKDVLPEDVLSSTGKIVLVLEASKENVADKGRATVIIDLPLEEKVEAPEFSDPAYQTKYVVVEDGTDTLNPAVKVSLKDVSDVTGIAVSIDEDSAKSFKIEASTDHWEVTVQQDLSSEALQKSVALITLTAQKDGASVSTQAVVVIELPNNNTQSSLYFEQAVYTADYNDNTITVNDKITLLGETENAIVQIDGDYKDNFAATYNTEDSTITVAVTSPLDQDVLNNNAAILATITATASEESASTSLVVKLPKSSGSSSLQFTSPAYLSTYNILDGNGQIALDDPIKIKGIDSVDGVTVITDGGYKNYFALIPEEDHWSLNVTKSLPQSVIDEEISILLNLQASDDNDPSPGYSSVVIQLPKKVSTTNFTFKSVVYSAEFEDNKLKFDSDIEITGDLTDVAITLGGDYAKYFNVNQDSLPKITISLNKKNDFTEVKDPVISLKLLAQRGEEVTESSISITIPDNVEGKGSPDEDKTGLIAAVAVLAVLLVASLVGSAVFYYLKFKRTNKYNNVDEPSHFRKSNNHDTKNKFEHPTRRPTGVIKYNLEDVDDTETDEKVDTAESVDESIPSTLDTRKSVQFDTINIDELEIEKTEDDTEEEGVLDQIDEEAEERRSSRV